MRILLLRERGVFFIEEFAPFPFQEPEVLRIRLFHPSCVFNTESEFVVVFDRDKDGIIFPRQTGVGIHMIENHPAGFRKTGAKLRFADDEQNLVRHPFFRNLKPVALRGEEPEGKEIELQIDSLPFHFINHAVPAVHIFRKRLAVLRGKRHDPAVESVHAEQIVSLCADGARVFRRQTFELLVVRSPPDFFIRFGAESEETLRIRILFKHDLAFGGEHRVSVLSCRRIDESGEVERASRLHRKIIGIDRVISLFFRKHLRFRRRLNGAPVQTPSLRTGDDFHRKQIFPFFDREKHKMVRGRNRLLRIAVRQCRIDKFSVQRNFHPPVCPETDGNQAVCRRFELIVEHSRIAETLAARPRLQTQIDLIAVDLRALFQSKRLDGLLFNSGQRAWNRSGSIHRGINQSENGPLRGKRRFCKLDFIEVDKEKFGKCHFPVQFPDIERKHRRIGRIFVFLSRNDFHKQFLHALCNRYLFEKTEVFRFVAQTVGDNERTRLRLFALNREVVTVGMSHLQSALNLLQLQ